MTPFGNDLRELQRSAVVAIDEQPFVQITFATVMARRALRQNIASVLGFLMNRLRPVDLAFSSRLYTRELARLHMGKQLDDMVRLVANPIGEVRLEAVLADAEASDAKAK
jgi:hypothetical protein